MTLRTTISTSEAKLDWPDEPRILTADDVIYHGVSSDDSRRSLDWWAEDFVDNTAKGSPCYGIVLAMLCQVLTERYGKEVRTLSLFLEFAQQRRISKAWLAACWNEMLSRLVYDVPKEHRKDPGLTYDEAQAPRKPRRKGSRA